jgi:hypothetical protein
MKVNFGVTATFYLFCGGAGIDHDYISGVDYSDSAYSIIPTIGFVYSI